MRTGSSAAESGTAGTGAAAPGTMRADARRNRERLLAAALATFAERGADSASLEEIARRAGVGIGTLYRHFPCRQALLESVYRDQVEALCARGEELLSQDSPGEALASWLAAMVQFGAAKRTLTTALLAGEGEAGDGKTGMDSPFFTSCRTDILATATALLTRAQQAGVTRPDLEVGDLLRLSHAIVVAVENVPDREEQSARLLSLMMGGVLRPVTDPGPVTGSGPVTDPAGGSRTGC